MTCALISVRQYRSFCYVARGCGRFCRLRFWEMSMRVRIIAVWTAVAVGVLLTVAAPPAGAVTLNTASVDCTGNPSALSNALAQATDVGGRWVLTTSGT